MTEPTQQDIDNAARRWAIGDRFRRQYEDARALAEQVLGQGWLPCGYHYLVEKDAEDEARRTNTKPTPSATVITCRNDAGEKRHFRVETMTECPTVDAGFGEMLIENHATKRFSVKGVEYPIHKYSLCWGWYEPGYSPHSAEQLAAARAKREQKADARWQAAVEAEAAGSLFPDWIKKRAQEERQRKNRGRGT